MMPDLPTLDLLMNTQTLLGKTVIVRSDLNVPMRHGKLLDDSRIQRAAPTLRELSDQGAKVLILSHFGRSKALHDLRPSLSNDTPSLNVILEPLAAALGRPVAFSPDIIGEETDKARRAMAPGDFLLLENLHALQGEIANDTALAEHLANLADLYVMDAFSCTDLAHASIVHLPRLLPSVIGRLMEKELTTLSKIMKKPERPIMAIVGGAKVSNRIMLLEQLASMVDILVVGGGIANTFLAALGHTVGHSLHEANRQNEIKKIMSQARASGCDVILPVDAVVAKAMENNSPHRTVAVKSIPEDDMILDMGPASTDYIMRRLGECRTVLWNGPVGAYEMPPYDKGTTAIAQAIASRSQTGKLQSIAGGAATIAALSRAGVRDDFTYLSLAGGAFLQKLEGRDLVGLAALRQSPSLSPERDPPTRA